MGRRFRGPRVTPVSELLLCFWTLLCVTSCEAQASLGRPPVANLQLHARLKTLTWDSASPARELRCRMDAPRSPTVTTAARALDNSTRFCSFPNAVLHHGANFTVYTVGANATFEETLSFQNAGRPGAGATNLSCVIYNVHSMNCSWAPGPAAPRDTCYQLFFWFKPVSLRCSLTVGTRGAGCSRCPRGTQAQSQCGPPWVSRKDNEAECTHYLTDSTPMRVGCHFARLPGEPRTSDNYFFLVNGTSSEAAVPFLDTEPFVPYLNEKYNPPANVSVRPAGLGFEVLWDNPARRFQQSASSLCYELQIRRKDGAPEGQPVFQRGQPRNAFPLPEGAAGGSVRLRVRHRLGWVWSEWGPAVRFGLDRDADGRSLGLARALMAVAGVVLGAAVLIAVCKRSSLQRWLLPPIPQVKEDLKDTFVSGQVTCKEASPVADYLEPKDVLVVEEIQ